MVHTIFVLAIAHHLTRLARTKALGILTSETQLDGSAVSDDQLADRVRRASRRGGPSRRPRRAKTWVMSLRERYPTSRESLSTASRPSWFLVALPSASNTESSGPATSSSVKGRMSSLTRRCVRCSGGTSRTCCFPKWETVYWYFSRWLQDGTR
mgnify:CR=1 FL=1